MTKKVLNLIITGIPSILKLNSRPKEGAILF